MSTVQTQVIRCGGCGKAAAWKPEYAGRKVRCKCGHVIDVDRAVGTGAGGPAAAAPADPPRPVTAARPAAARPAAPTRPAAARPPATRPAAATPPPAPAPTPAEPVDPFADGASFDDIVRAAAAEAAAPPAPAGPGKPGRASGGGGGGRDDDHGAYGLAPEPAIPVQPIRQSRATLAPALAAGGPTSPVVGYAGFVKRRGADEEREQVAEYQRQNLILPAVLIAVGLLATFAEARMAIGQTDLLLMCGYVALTTVVNLVLIFAALLITSKLLDLGLGEVGPALLKITAVAILPSAISGIITEATGGMGGMLAWAVSLGCYFALLYFLFDMDGQEMMICTTIIWAIRTWVGYFIFMALMSSMSGVDLSAGAGGGGSGTPGGPGGGGGGAAPWVAPGAADPDDDAAADPDDPDMEDDDADAPAKARAGAKKGAKPAKPAGGAAPDAGSAPPPPGGGDAP